MYTAVIGLGNPGPQYRLTRHNIGQRILENLVAGSDIGLAKNPQNWKKKFNGHWAQHNSLRLLVPETFMNKCGSSVQAFANFFSLSPEQLLIIHDDLELPFGDVQLKKGGGLAGHNGLKSIATHLSSREFYRLRVGIGRPPRGDVSKFVLERFNQQEEAELDDIIAEAIQQILNPKDL